MKRTPITPGLSAFPASLHPLLTNHPVYVRTVAAFEIFR